jgi:hypothetical protein
LRIGNIFGAMHAMGAPEAFRHEHFNGLSESPLVCIRTGFPSGN